MLSMLDTPKNETSGQEKLTPEDKEELKLQLIDSDIVYECEPSSIFA